MRLVEWTEFHTLPSGTIFQEWEPHWLGPLEILAEFWGRDFVAAELTPSCISGDNLERGHALENADMLIAMPSGFGRDGVFDHEKRRWLIWDEADRKRLAGWLLDPAAAVAVQNDDDELYVLPTTARD